MGGRSGRRRNGGTMPWIIAYPSYRDDDRGGKGGESDYERTITSMSSTWSGIGILPLVEVDSHARYRYKR
jgi:hypothetical protein